MQRGPAPQPGQKCYGGIGFKGSIIFYSFENRFVPDGEYFMTSKDIRWIQRFSNYKKAMRQLVQFIEKGELNELEKQGLIKCFEYCYELAWNTMKDFYESQGETDIHGSRDAIRLAFKRGLLEDGETWMDMIKSRTLTTHTYNEEKMQEITAAIQNRYSPVFSSLQEKLNQLEEKESRL